MKILICYFFAIQIIFSAFNKTAFLQGNTTLGYYYLDILIGNPPQKQTLIVDTGSYMTVFPCKGCLKCGKHENLPFDSEKSETFEFLKPHGKYFNWTCENASKTRCHFQQTYVEGSEYMGYYAIDDITIDLKNKFKEKMIFGCALSETNEFFSQKVDGIIGLGILKGLNYIPPSPTDMMFFDKTINSNSFSILLGENNGQLRFGGWNIEFHDQKSSKTFIDCSDTDWQTQYQLDLTSIMVILKDSWSKSELRLFENERTAIATIYRHRYNLHLFRSNFIQYFH